MISKKIICAALCSLSVEASTGMIPAFWDNTREVLNCVPVSMQNDESMIYSTAGGSVKWTYVSGKLTEIGFPGGNLTIMNNAITALDPDSDSWKTTEASHSSKAGAIVRVDCIPVFLKNREGFWHLEGTTFVTTDSGVLAIYVSETGIEESESGRPPMLPK